MIELNMASNHFLRLDFQRKKFEYCDPTKFSLWIEIFVVGDVSLTGTDHSWDKIGIGQSDEYDDDDSDDDDSDDYDDDYSDYDDDDDSDDDSDYSDNSDDNYDDDYDDEPRYNGYHRYYNNY